MVLTDPRYIFGYPGYFDPASSECKVDTDNLTDNDGNPMTYEANYANDLMNLDDLFITKGVDVVFVIGQISYPTVESYRAVYNISIQPYAIDKDTRVTATTALWKAEQEIIRILRENPVGSFRSIENAKPLVARLSPTIVWGTLFSVLYIQYASAYGTYTAPNRRFYNYIKEWRVGTASDSYSSVGEASGLGPLSWTQPDPWVTIPVKGSNRPIILPTGDHHILDGVLMVHDRYAVTRLLRTIDVVAGGGTETAVSTTGRNVIGYMAFIINESKIVNSTDARSSTTTSFVFSRARITSIREVFADPSSPVEVRFTADSPVITPA